VTAQGHPRAIVRRAIANGNLPGAEIAAREISRVSLSESLALTALVAQKDTARHSRYAIRWLRRLLEKDPHLTIEEAALATCALAALGGRMHAQALSTLSAMAERATSRGARRRLPS
jgi:hypothetical protein